MARESFASFAERLVRNGEIQEFMEALIEAGSNKTTLRGTIERIEDKKIECTLVGVAFSRHYGRE